MDKRVLDTLTCDMSPPGSRSRMVALYLPEIIQLSQTDEDTFHHIFAASCKEKERDAVELLFPLTNPRTVKKMSRVDALECLVDMGHVAAVGHLLKAYKTDELSLPLHEERASGYLLLCARHKNSNTLSLLLPFVGDRLKNWMCSWAAKQNNTRILSAILPTMTDLSQIQFALFGVVSKGHLDAVKVLLPFVDPKHQQSKALQMASYYGFQDIFNLLYPLSDPKEALSKMEAGFFPDDKKRLLLDRLAIETAMETKKNLTVGVTSLDGAKSKLIEPTIPKKLKI